MMKSRATFKILYNYISFRYTSSISQRKRICIVGSGPAGFYTAAELLRSKLVEVDIFEKLPVPFGLVRYGIAPDHQDVKNATNSFTSTAKNEYCKFYGNVNIGQDISISELSKAYHAIVLAYGSEKDKSLGIPGEDLKNVLSAKKFVSWYNGHPDFTNLDVDLDCETAVIIGHGNVAIDMARILLKNVDELKQTDIAEYTLEKLRKSRIKRVVLAGRRGPAQVSFQNKEYREMTKLFNVDGIVHPEDFVEICEKIPNFGMPLAPKVKRKPGMRIVELLYQTSQNQEYKQEKAYEIKFYRSPKCIISDFQGKVKNVVFGITKLKDILSKESEVYETNEEEIIDCGLVLKSVGQQGVCLEPPIPFDEKKCIIPNISGKVVGAKGLYCSGWIKTGPVGNLALTMTSCYETAASIAHDINNGEFEATPSVKREDLLNSLKEKDVKCVTFEDYEKINKLELERGQAMGKVREKLYSNEEMLSDIA